MSLAAGSLPEPAPAPAPAPASASVPVPVQRVDHAGLDAVAGDAVAVFCWSDLRPLSGTPGYIDWRLCGGLSRLLQQREFEGRLDEAVLLPVRGRFGPRRIFLFGLGDVDGQSPKHLRQVVRTAYEVMRRAGARVIVFAAPHARGRPDIEGDFVTAVAEELPHLVDLVLLAR